MSLRNLPEPDQAERLRDHPLTLDFQKLLEWTTVVFNQEVFRAFGRRELLSVTRFSGAEADGRSVLEDRPGGGQSR
jgi:hypothetical protein